MDIGMKVMLKKDTTETTNEGLRAGGIYTIHNIVSGQVCVREGIRRTWLSKKLFKQAEDLAFSLDMAKVRESFVYMYLEELMAREKVDSVGIFMRKTPSKVEIFISSGNENKLFRTVSDKKAVIRMLDEVKKQVKDTEIGG